MKINILIEIIEDLQKIQNKRTLSNIERKILLNGYKKYIEENREQYMHNPVFHHLCVSQMNAIAMGEKDWMLYGSLYY